MEPPIRHLCTSQMQKGTNGFQWAVIAFQWAVIAPTPFILSESKT